VTTGAITTGRTAAGSTWTDFGDQVGAAPARPAAASEDAAADPRATSAFVAAAFALAVIALATRSPFRVSLPTLTGGDSRHAHGR